MIIALHYYIWDSLLCGSKQSIAFIRPVTYSLVSPESSIGWAGNIRALTNSFSLKKRAWEWVTITISRIKGVLQVDFRFWTWFEHLTLTLYAESILQMCHPGQGLNPIWLAKRSDLPTHYCHCPFLELDLSSAIPHTDWRVHLTYSSQATHQKWTESPGSHSTLLFRTTQRSILIQAASQALPSWIW